MTQPAFPHIAFNTVGGINVVEPGLTKRELFAAFAMAGMLAREDMWQHMVAKQSFEIAEEMILASSDGITHCSDCGRNLSETGGGSCQTCEVK